MLLPAPAQVPADHVAEAVFRETGRQACHVTSLRTSTRAVPMYS